MGVSYAPFAFSATGGPTCPTYESQGALAVGDRCGNAIYVGSINGEQLFADSIASKEKQSWGASTATCADLGAGWRVPNRVELKLLFDDRHTGALTETIDSGWHWSSSRASGLGTRWILDFETGDMGNASEGNEFAVRCVWSKSVE
jgi:hypothetical protein